MLHELLKKLPTFRTTLHILEHIKVYNGQATFTSLDWWLQTPCDAENGIYEHGKVKKTGNFEGAKTDIPFSEFPSFHTFKSEYEIQLPELAPFKPFCSDDFSNRVSLTGISLEKTAICATNGHIVHSQKYETGIKKPVIFRADCCRIADYLQQMGAKISVLEYEEDFWVKYSLNDTSFFIKCIEGPYPEWEKIIPEKFEYEDCTNIELFQNIARTLLPYAHCKSKHIVFEDSYVWASQEDKAVKVEVDGPMFQIPIGFNAEYIQIVTKDLKNPTVSYNTNVGAVVFEENDTTRVLMPSRIGLEEDRPSPDAMEAISLQTAKRNCKKKSLTASQIKTIIKNNQTKTGREILEMIKES